MLILVDGIRLNNSYFRRGPNQYFNTIDPGMVDHIEVLRGQGSVLWGSDAIGGAINVVHAGCETYIAACITAVTRKNSSRNTSTRRTHLHTAESTLKAGSIRLASSAEAASKNVRDLDTGFDDLSRQPGTNYQQWAGDLKLNYLLTNESMLTFSMQHVEQEDLPRSDRFPGFPQDRNNSNTTGGARFFDPQQRDLMYIRYQALNPFGGMFDAIYRHRFVSSPA